MASEKFAEMKQRSGQDKERLRERIKNDWLEVVKDRLIDVASRFGIAWGEDANIRSRRFKK